MSESESLFSLELTVDKLFLPSTACRFPAVAFRLLDFPTLIIHHVESNLGDAIKSKVRLRPEYKVPHQINELKDHHGWFVIQKGKSCLFKVSMETLRNHLIQTPLYVMIIDTFTDVPKLVGSCYVSLKCAMEMVYTDILERGISVPTVHGEKGEFKVYNLMGSEIGCLSLGFRLLSLGAGLLAHLPSSAVTQVGGRKTVVKFKSQDMGESDKQAIIDTVDTILSDLHPQDDTIKQNPVLAPEVAPEKEKSYMPPLTDKSKYQTTSTQTRERVKPKRSEPFQRDASPDHFEDEFQNIYLSNTVCPPPLFYNSTSDTNFNTKVRDAWSDVESVTYSYIDSQSQDRYESDFTSSGEEDRNEDNVGKEESGLSVKQLKSATEAMSPVRKTLKKTMPNEKHGHTEAVDHSNFSNMEHLLQFPLLKALMSEFAQFQNAQILLPTQDEQPMHSKNIHQQLPQPHVHVGERKPVSSPRSKSRSHLRFANGKENHDSLNTKHSSPKRSEKDCRGGSHRGCAHAQLGVPKNKGWIRQAPEYGVRKTKLSYGMTNTQRLRLAKSNPGLYQTLEKQHKDEKMKKHSLSVGRHLQGLTVDFQDLHMDDVVTEVAKHPALDQKTELGATAVIRSTAVPPLMLNQIGSPVRRPVPTPRLSKSQSVDIADTHTTPNEESDYDDSYNDRELPPMSVDITAMGIDAPVLVQSDKSVSKSSSYSTAKSNKSHSHRSIEIHIPSASIPDGDEYSSNDTSHYESDLPDDEYEREINDPGFKDDFLAGESVHSSVSVPAYSDDFNTSNLKDTSEPELKRIIEEVDTYSSVSYHSAESKNSNTSRHSRISLSVASSHGKSVSEKSQQNGKRLKIPAVNPVASSYSPMMSVRHSGSVVDSQFSHTARTVHEPTESPPPRPRPKPRLSKTRSESVNTDSVSSYMPSDPDNVDYSEADLSYSDNAFEKSEDESGSKRQASVRHILPKAAKHF